MKLRHVIIILSVLFPGSIKLYSQVDSLPASISIDQAISLAIQSNPGLKIKELSYLIALEKLNESRMSMIPQMYGQYDIQRNLIIPSTLVPVGVFNPSLPPDEMMPIKFGTRWTSAAGLYASVKVFDPQVIGDIKEKKASIPLSDIDRKISRIDLEILTIKAYAACLIAEKQLRYAENDTVNSFLELTESNLKFKSGLLKQIDLNQSLINHNNTLSRYRESGKVMLDARKTLLYQMGIEKNDYDNFMLSDSLDLLISRLASGNYVNSDPVNSLTNMRLLAQNNIDNLRLKNARAGFLPVVSIKGLYGSDYFNNRFLPGNDNFWYGNSNISLSLRIPLTDGINRTKRIAQLKYQIDSDREEYHSEMNKKKLDFEKTLGDVEFYKKDIIAKKSSLDFAKENYNSAFSQFRAGRILLSELSQAELLYKQVKLDYLKALYNYVDSLLNLKKIAES